MDEYLKRCHQCGETKSRDLFDRNRAQADGLQTRCRMCEHGIDQKRCADCELPVTGYAKRCREHQAEAGARKLAQAEHGRQLREAAAASRAAVDERKQTRRCAECDGHIDVTKPRHARYCGKECRDAVNKRKQQADYRAARTVIERSCADCRTDLTERATSHPGATRARAARRSTGRTGSATPHPGLPSGTAPAAASP